MLVLYVKRKLNWAPSTSVSNVIRWSCCWEFIIFIYSTGTENMSFYNQSNMDSDKWCESIWFFSVWGSQAKLYYMPKYSAFLPKQAISSVTPYCSQVILSWVKSILFGSANNRFGLEAFNSLSDGPPKNVTLSVQSNLTDTRYRQTPHSLLYNT